MSKDQSDCENLVKNCLIRFDTTERKMGFTFGGNLRKYCIFSEFLQISDEKMVLSPTENLLLGVIHSAVAEMSPHEFIEISDRA